MKLEYFALISQGLYLIRPNQVRSGNNMSVAITIAVIDISVQQYIIIRAQRMTIC
jgi:hypothetical protein